MPQQNTLNPSSRSPVPCLWFSCHKKHHIFQVPVILELEVAMHQLLRQRASRLVQRRQDDIKDESSEFSSLSSQSILKVFIWMALLFFFFTFLWLQICKDDIQLWLIAHQNNTQRDCPVCVWLRQVKVYLAFGWWKLTGFLLVSVYTEILLRWAGEWFGGRVFLTPVRLNR